MSNVLKVKIADTARRIAERLDNDEYFNADTITAEEITTLPRDYLTVLVFVLLQLPMGKHSFKDLVIIDSLIGAGIAVNCADGKLRPTRIGRFIMESIVRARTSDWRPENA